MNILEEGPLRKLLRERGLLKRFQELPVIGVKGVDATIERLKEEKKAEWRRRGYSETLISMAVSLADDWASSMASAFAPPELKESVLRHIYPKALDVADRWITKIGEAVKASLLELGHGSL